MYRAFLLALAGAAFLAGCVAVVPIGAGIDTSTRSSAPAARAASTPFTALINDFRASQGRGQVLPNRLLNRAAQAHAEDMVRRGYFSHRSPGGPNGTTFIQRSRAAGCRSGTGAENIATGQRSEAAVLEAWKNSSGHRRNMLGARYTDYGLGRSGNVWVLVLSTAC